MASSRAAPKTRQWRAAGAPPHPPRRGASAPQGRWLLRPSSVARTGFGSGRQKSPARWPRGTLSRAARLTFAQSLTGQHHRTPPAAFRAPDTPAPIGEVRARFAASMPRPTSRGIIVPPGGRARPGRGAEGAAASVREHWRAYRLAAKASTPALASRRGARAARLWGGHYGGTGRRHRAGACRSSWQSDGRRRGRPDTKSPGARAAAGRETLRVGAAAFSSVHGSAGPAM